MSQEAPPVRKNARGSITREQKRLQIINALGHAYSFILLIDIKKNTLEVVKSADVAGPNYRKENLTNELQKEYK